MELFATDRDRLAFLLETDAALDLDFEALEAQAEAAAEEPSPEQRPKYITNYIGSKQKLVDWIWKHTPEGVESVVDAFSGSAVVAYMYKTKGLRVLANEWGNRLGAQPLSGLVLDGGFFAISEPVHNHEYPLLWDLIFERHPKGDFFRGKFNQMGRPYPPRSLLEEMFEAQPVALILDEFQKWFDGLSDQPGPEGIKYRTWAENFIQNLSELSKERPDLLILVVSVLNNNTEAFRQIHRDGPVIIDFRGPTAKEDRKNLLLYRLFENRQNIPTDEIRSLLDSYASERFRLRFSHLPESERSRVVSEVMACWPFSPELMELLEDHILMAEAAQETRDLIRLLLPRKRRKSPDHYPGRFLRG